MSGSQCCFNEEIKDSKVCKVLIAVGHSNTQEKNRMTDRLKTECKKGYDRVGVACCYQEQTAAQIPGPQQFPNKRTDQELDKGAPTIAAMESEIEAAKTNLCNSNEKCCSSVVISFVSIGGDAGKDVHGFQKKHKEYQAPNTTPSRHGSKSQIPLKCEKTRSCSERGGIGS